MAEKNLIKPRLCRKCEETVLSTAKGLKAHADKCETMRPS